MNEEILHNAQKEPVSLLSVVKRERQRIEWATQTAKLVNEKNKAYGDSFLKTGEILHLMCPEIPKDKCVMMLTAARILDKLFRLLNDPSAFNEDPADDIIGYGLLVKELLHNNR